MRALSAPGTVADGACWALAVALACGATAALLGPVWGRMGRVADWALDRCWWR